MKGSIRIARLAGIDVYVHFSWILIFLLVTFSLANEVLPTSWSEPKQLIVAAIAALLFFASVLTHELAHSFVARRFGMTVSSITLFLLGGVANLKQEPPTARAELFMAAAGPLTSFAIAGLARLAQEAGTAVLDRSAMSTISPVIGYLTTVNVAVGVFNLLPGFPMDGGRVLRSVIWAIRGDRVAATRVAARGGHIVALGIGLIGGLLLVLGETVGLWYCVIAYFLYDTASASLVQERLMAVAQGVRVGQLMTTDFRSALPDMKVDVVVRELMLPFNLPMVPIVRDGQLLGVLTIGDLQKIDREHWPEAQVGEVMTPTTGPSLSPDDELMIAVERFDGASLLPVTRRGVLLGVLHPESVATYLRMRDALARVPTAPRPA